jgi:hypothetical protein
MNAIVNWVSPMRVTGLRLAHDQKGVMAQDPTEEPRRGV